MKHGPVDVIVIASGEPRFDGSMFEELERLGSAGTIRVLDAMVLIKDEAGVTSVINIEDLPAEDRAKLGFIDTGTNGLFGPDDAEVLFEGMCPGSAVVAFAIEHVWAIGLVNAMVDAGAELAMNWRIPAPIVDEAFASLGK